MSLRYRNLIRKIMRTFYDIPESLVMEYIYYHDRIEQGELAKLLHLDANKIRSYVVKFKRDKFIIEDHRLESNQNNVGPRTKDLYYYRIDIPSFINVVNYRLIQMLHFVENLERQQTYKQTKYKCIRCEKEYTEFDIGKLFDISQDALVCSMCGDLVQEDNETKETTTEPAQAVTVSLYNEQMKPLFEILREIDELNRQEQHLSDSTTLNGNSTLASGNHHTNTGSIPVPATHRSHASTVFDRTATINHNIDIFIERDDDDDHYAPMDIDETSNTDSFIGSSRGPGKPGKKPSKPVQSTAEVATQPISAKMKAANKKVPYEPKPTPIWFLESTVHIEQEERRSNNSTTQTTTTTTTTTTSMSRQLSNSKLTKTSRLNDIKQLLLAHERKNKTLSLTNNIEDSLSPPTPIQLTRTTDSQ